MILVVLSTHAELASATARGRSYCKTGLLFTFLIKDFIGSKNGSLLHAQTVSLSKQSAVLHVKQSVDTILEKVFVAKTIALQLFTLYVWLHM